MGYWYFVEAFLAFQQRRVLDDDNVDVVCSILRAEAARLDISSVV